MSDFCEPNERDREAALRHYCRHNGRYCPSPKELLWAKTGEDCPDEMYEDLAIEFHERATEAWWRSREAIVELLRLSAKNFRVECMEDPHDVETAANAWEDAAEVLEESVVKGRAEFAAAKEARERGRHE